MAERVEGLVGSDYGSFGKLIPIGGRARNEELAFVANEVSSDTGIAILTAPTGMPDEEFHDYETRFRGLGVSGDIFHLSASLTSAEGQMMLDRSSVAFITGGNQLKGRQSLSASGMDVVLREFNRRGGVVGGSSAGSSLIGEIMPIDDMTTDGLMLFQGVIIDQHFEERHREGRLMRAVSVTRKIGIGINEGTGVIYESGKAKVFGKGVVHLVSNYMSKIDDTRFRRDEIIDFSSVHSD